MCRITGWGGVLSLIVPVFTYERGREIQTESQREKMESERQRDGESRGVGEKRKKTDIDRERDGETQRVEQRDREM